VAYVLSGRRDDHGMHDLLDAIPVLPAGWTDQAEVRQLGERWIRDQKHPRHVNRGQKKSPDTWRATGTSHVITGRLLQRRCVVAVTEIAQNES
jgi:hypothetical protein